eukprot:jgi/Tetstr1/454236/TSEL_041155.t1
MLQFARAAFAAGEVAVTHSMDRRAAARLAAARAQDLGPTFIKLGQLASTRGDVLPAEYFEEFARLRDDVRADPPEVAVRRARLALGVASLDEVFAEFDTVPDASASVAQVHRARLRDTGQIVAVKILKTGVRESIEKDLEMARAVAGLLALCSPPSLRARIDTLVERYGAVLRRETDLVAEAAAASAARRTLVHAFGDDVIVPRPIISRPGIIVMEYVPSVPLREARDGHRMTSLVIESVLTLIAAGEGFHRDPHDGNLGVVREAGVERLVIYDFGNVASLSAGALDGLLEAGVAFQMKDADMMADALIKHRLVESEFPRQQYRPALLGMIRQGFEYVRTMDVRAFDPGKLDRGAAERMQLSDEVDGVVRAVTMAEGVCKSAHAGFDLQRAIDEYLAVHSSEIALDRARRDIASIMRLLDSP